MHLWHIEEGRFVTSKSEAGELKKWRWRPQWCESSDFNYVTRNWAKCFFFATLTCKSPAVTQLSSENQTLSECSFPWTVFPWVDHRLKMSRSLSLPSICCFRRWQLLLCLISFEDELSFQLFLRDRVKYLVSPHLLNFQNSKISCSRFFGLHNACN